MPAIASTVSNAASPERIWRVLADVARWPEWLPTVSAVEPLDSPDILIGKRYRLQQPKLRPAVWTVTEIEPLRKFTWESRSSGVRAVADHVIEQVTGERATVVLSVRFSGVLGGL